MSPTLPLVGGDALPALGFGCWKVPAKAAPDVIKQAIHQGYRHIDSACDYGNEDAVGAGLRAADCAREEIWVTSKLWNTYHDPAHVRAACERSLHDLGLDYLDLYHVHFPISLAYVDPELRYPPGWFHEPKAANPSMVFADIPMHETWSAMEELVDAGLVRNIGVCNLNTAFLRDLAAGARIQPAVHQIELHPYLAQEKMLELCVSLGIAVTGFSPFGASSYVPIAMASAEDRVLDDPVVAEIANSCGRSAAQVLLRWGIQRGTAVVPKATQIPHMRENFAIFDFELSAEQVASISALDRHQRFNDPGDFCPRFFNTDCPIYE
ncbi:MAG: D-xylose reductase [Rhodothermales bacterium]|jgi:D-xylose reductase